jgi:hypothetical protein
MKLASPAWYKWLKTCSQDPVSPANIAKGSLGMLTGQDFRALNAVAACWELYAGSDDDGQRAALEAIRALLPGMQPKCLFFARELVAFAMNWEDRDHLWMLVTTREIEPP